MAREMNKLSKAMSVVLIDVLLYGNIRGRGSYSFPNSLSISISLRGFVRISEG